MTSCAACGREIVEQSRFCPHCGKAVLPDAIGATETVSRSTKAPFLAPPNDGSGRTRDARPPSSSSGTIDHGIFLPGTMITRRYRIVGLLGRGGMGEVYRADDLKLSQAVALKFLPDRLSTDAARLARFHNEVRIARQIAHPNACRVYDIDEVEGRHFLTMEYVDGEDLAGLLRRIGRLPQEKGIQIARQICAGLAAAHENGILHRDLKPANIMLDARGRARIMDFGLAGLADEFRAGDVRAGTPAYMAPEQLTGREVSVRSDIYQLGLLLYEIFTGRRAFQADTTGELLQLQTQSTPPSASSVVGDIDPTIERVIQRCLQSEPRNRPGSALAVAAALPGADPLAAALAAGETPAPEMVAAAGEIGALRPRTAVVCLAATVVGLIAYVVLSDSFSLLGLVPPEHPPDVLAAKARELIVAAGYRDPPMDTAHGYWFSDLTKYVEEHDPSPQRWIRLKSGRPPVYIYWFRQSPAYLKPMDFLGWVGSVTNSDPPPDLPGMTSVQLDSAGRLLKLEAVPAQMNDPPAAAKKPNWPLLFDRAGLDLSKFHSVPSEWRPRNYAEERAAWSGVWPGRADLPLRVEAAALNGRPVYFELVSPWDKPRSTEPEFTTRAEFASNLIGLALFLAIVVGSALLARRNLKLGRGDRTGASRVAMFVVACSLGRWGLDASHVPNFFEIGMFVIASSSALFFGALTWMVYVALEPYARRRWPHALISWSRALSGRLRDPLVGRDVLVGCVTGVGVSLIGFAALAVQAWMGHPPPPMATVVYLSNLLAPRHVAALLLSSAMNAAILALTVFFLFFLVRLVLRRSTLAGLAFALVLSANAALDSSQPIVGAVTVAVYFGAMIVCLLRHGLLALTALWLASNILDRLVATRHLDAWYGTGTLAGVLAILTLAGYGFYTSLAGQRLIADSALET